MSDVNVKAAELFAAGESVNGVAKALNISWAAAKKLEGGGTVAPRKKRGRKPRVVADAAEPETADELEAFDLTLNVETGSLAPLFATFTPGEQAAAVQFVLQTRVDEALGA